MGSKRRIAQFESRDEVVQAISTELIGKSLVDNHPENESLSIEKTEITVSDNDGITELTTMTTTSTRDTSANVDENTSVVTETTEITTIVNEDGTTEVTSHTTTDVKESTEPSSGVNEESPGTEAETNNGYEVPLDSPSKPDSSTGTKKKKPLSPSMQRLTAKKGESPTSQRRSISAEERKSKAVDIRKKKILEQRSKEDDRRAAVLERKRRLEEAERQRKEALFKKLTADAPSKPEEKASIRKKYSASTSNLSQLRKTKLIEREIKLDDGNKLDVKSDKNKPPDRPVSALQRARPSSSASNLHKVKDKKPIDKEKQPNEKRPATTEFKKSSKPPAARLSLNPRPATAMGVSSSDRRKTLQATSHKSTAPVKISSSITSKPLKSKSTGSPGKKSEIDTKKPNSPKKTDSAVEKPQKVPIKKKEIREEKTKTEKSKSPKAPGTMLSTTVKEKTTPSKPKSSSTKTTQDVKSPSEKENVTSPKSSASKLKKTETEKAKKIDTDKKKKAATEKPKQTTPQDKKKPSSKQKTESKTAQMTEEEAKKALAERRKKAKEEAESKAKAEREKDEELKKQQEEEERILAEQLKEEERKQSELLQQLQKEEDERREKMMEEKEQREREEKERQEEEQRLREEEIERKAKLELEKIQKEQEKKEQELDAQRIERKKRVEMIMARVSAKRNAASSESSTATPNVSIGTIEDDASFTNEAQQSSDSARLKVDGILRARGLGRSTEDLLKNTDDSTTNEPQEAPVSVDTPSEAPLLTSESIVTADSEETNAPEDIDVNSTVGKSINSPTIDNVEELNINDEPGMTTEDGTTSNGQETSNISLEKPEPVSAWSEKETFENEDKPRVTTKPEDEQVSLDVDTEATVINEFSETIKETLAPDNDLDENNKMVTTSNNNVILTNGDSTEPAEDLSHTTEQEQWSHFETTMKQKQPGDTVVTDEDSEESKLWRVMEGKVELSECF